MKRKTAKEILADSFRELSGHMPIDKITVNDITKNCGYSPATFYRQFRDKYDLIAWDYSRDIEQIMGQLRQDRRLWRKVLEDAAVYYYEHKSYLENLLLHTSGYDSFARYMTEIHIRSLCECISQFTDVSSGEVNDTKMCIHIFCMGSVAFTCEWILGKYELTAHEVADIYANALPDILGRYFS